MNDRLIALYEKKYGGEFDRWHEDMQTGFYSGERKLIRYTPGFMKALAAARRSAR